MTNKICDGCETVAHCLKNNCISRLNIIRMAKDAGAIPIHKEYKQNALVRNENIERFAALVAAASASVEREACAALCDRFANRMMSADECADAIRARGVASIRGETK